MNGKRGISPVIATVLLIAIVIVLALIVFLWATRFIGESVTKKNSPIEQICNEVNLEARYIGDKLQVTNIGTVYLYRADVIKVSGGEENNNPEDAINRLGMGMSDIKNIGSGYDEVKVVPVILGEAESGKKAYTCKNNIFIAE